MSLDDKTDLVLIDKLDDNLVGGIEVDKVNTDKNTRMKTTSSPSLMGDDDDDGLLSMYLGELLAFPVGRFSELMKT